MLRTDVFWSCCMSRVSCSSYVFCLVVFKQKTAYEMRIGDWSSDVCSSDLPPLGAHGAVEGAWFGRVRLLHQSRQPQGRRAGCEPAGRAAVSLEVAEIGRASCRARVCQYV